MKHNKLLTKWIDILRKFLVMWRAGYNHLYKKRARQSRAWVCCINKSLSWKAYKLKLIRHESLLKFRIKFCLFFCVAERENNKHFIQGKKVFRNIFLIISTFKHLSLCLLPFQWFPNWERSFFFIFHLVESKLN